MDIKQFYEEVVTFDTFIEFRIMNIETGKMFSMWASCIDEVNTIYSKYDKFPYNIYYGINTRKIKGLKDIDIETRRLLYFDIEHASSKPPFTDEAYKKELLETAHYITTELEKKYNIKPTFLTSSGRGIHLYYMCFPLSRENYETKFKYWFKQIKSELDKKKPYAHIKFNDPMQNIGRIASAPFSHHNKYPEKPLREILHVNTSNISDFQNILDNFKMPEFKPKKKIIIKNGYTEKTIFGAPEFKVFELNIPQNGEFMINNKLRLALRLLMDAHNVQNREEVAQRIASLGYVYKTMLAVDNPDYVYSVSVLNNWCLDHWKFCLEKNFIIPYAFPKNKQHKFIEKEDSKEYEVRELCSPWDVYYYVKNFNNATSVALGGDRTAFYVKAMKENVLKNIRSTDLMSWLSDNKFLEKIKVVK